MRLRPGSDAEAKKTIEIISEKVTPGPYETMAGWSAEPEPDPDPDPPLLLQTN
jgi:hypothetical protein